MAILARYTPKNIEVEVIDVLHTAGNRKMAVIRAIEGQPFAAHSFNGGPMMTDAAVVDPAALVDVHQVQPQPVNPYGNTRRSRLGAARPEPVYVPFNGD